MDHTRSGSRETGVSMPVLEEIAPSRPAVPARISHHTSPGEWLQAVRGEYLEIPRLSLTRAQVQSLWGLHEDQCDQILESLLTSGFLKVTEAGGFVRA